MQAVSPAFGYQEVLSGQGDIQVTGKRMGHGTSVARGKDGEKHRNSFCEIRRD